MRRRRTSCTARPRLAGSEQIGIGSNLCPSVISVVKSSAPSRLGVRFRFRFCSQRSSLSSQPNRSTSIPLHHGSRFHLVSLRRQCRGGLPLLPVGVPNRIRGPIKRFGDLPPQPGQPPLSAKEAAMVMNISLPILGGHVIIGNDAPEFWARGFRATTSPSTSNPTRAPRPIAFLPR